MGIAGNMMSDTVNLQAEDSEATNKNKNYKRKIKCGTVRTG